MSIDPMQLLKMKGMWDKNMEADIFYVSCF